MDFYKVDVGLKRNLTRNVPTALLNERAIPRARSENTHIYLNLGKNS